MSEARKAVLMTIALLAATSVERSAYENVEGGKQAWDELVAEGLIVKNDNNFYILSLSGREAVQSLHREYGRKMYGRCVGFWIDSPE